jgi:mRNA-degrading endonuclease toxin of MazEF toxin-antitoxin module
MAAYVPKQGDFVALNFDPQLGHEQQGRTEACAGGEQGRV